MRRFHQLLSPGGPATRIKHRGKVDHPGSCFAVLPGPAGIVLAAALACVLAGTVAFAEETAPPLAVDSSRVQVDAGEFETALALGDELYREGRREEAEGAYRKAITILPDDPRARVKLGIVLNESGSSEAAIEEFDRALAAAPEDVEAICRRGQSLYALRRYDEAVGHYREALAIHPNSQLAHYLLGVAFADAGIYREAIREWRKVVQIDPDTESGRTAQEGVEVLESIVDQN